MARSVWKGPFIEKSLLASVSVRGECYRVLILSLGADWFVEE